MEMIFYDTWQFTIFYGREYSVYDRKNWSKTGFMELSKIISS